MMSLPSKVLPDQLLKRISLLLRDARVFRRRAPQEKLQSERGFWRPLARADLDAARRWEGPEDVPRQWMNFLFNTDRDSEVVCESVVWSLTEHFDVTAEEALGRVNRHWLGQTLAGDESLRFRSVEFWANMVYYGEASEWWNLDEAERQRLKPQPYPKRFERFAICAHCAEWKQLPESACSECGELPEGDALERSRKLSSESIKLPRDPIAARIRLLEIRDEYLSQLADPSD